MNNIDQKPVFDFNDSSKTWIAIVAGESNFNNFGTHFLAMVYEKNGKYYYKTRFKFLQSGDRISGEKKFERWLGPEEACDYLQELFSNISQEAAQEVGVTPRFHCDRLYFPKDTQRSPEKLTQAILKWETVSCEITLLEIKKNEPTDDNQKVAEEKRGTV